MSVGRLGILVDVTLAMKPQPVLVRTRQDVAPDVALKRMEEIQQIYAAAKQTGDPSRIEKAMQQIGSILVCVLRPQPPQLPGDLGIP